MRERQKVNRRLTAFDTRSNKFDNLPLLDLRLSFLLLFRDLEAQHGDSGLRGT